VGVFVGFATPTVERARFQWTSFPASFCWRIQKSFAEKRTKGGASRRALCCRSSNAPADELSVDKELRNGGPVAKRLDARAHCRVRQYVKHLKYRTSQKESGGVKDTSKNKLFGPKQARLEFKHNM